MTLKLPIVLYFVWTEEYCQTSPNQKQIAKPLTRNKHLSLLYFRFCLTKNGRNTKKHLSSQCHISRDFTSNKVECMRQDCSQKYKLYLNSDFLFETSNISFFQISIGLANFKLYYLSLFVIVSIKAFKISLGR